MNTRSVTVSGPTKAQTTAAPGVRLLLFIAAVTLVRLWVAGVVHLTEDEAYYRLWAASLQFGYYDHPPMIAWWIRAGTMIAGDNALGVRLLPVIACTVTSFIIYDLTQRLGASPRTAQRATIWYNATLIIGLGGFLAIPDAPAVLFWSLALWCVVRAQEGPLGRWWIAAGVAAGLATISKYSALFLAPGVAIWLVWKGGGWRALLRPWPWVAAVIAGAFFSTNLIWNAGHQWVSFAKQFGRIEPHGFAPEHLAELILVEFVLLNPLISIFAGRGVVQSFKRSGPKEGPDLSLLLAISAPFTAYLLLHSLHARVEAHWPAPLYPGLAILAAVAADPACAGGAWIRLRRATAPLGIALSVLAMLHLMIPASDLTSVADPSLAIRDWPGFATRVEAERKAQGAAWIGTIHYGTDAQLALEHPRAPVAELIERDRFPPTDSSWRADTTKPGLVVDLGRRAPDMEALRGCFAEVEQLGYIDRGQTPYVAFRVAGPRRDVLNEGCWASMDAMHAENHRYRALGFTPNPPPGRFADRR